MSARLFPERIAELKRRIVEVLSTCEVPRLQQQEIHVRMGLELTKSQLTALLATMHAGRALCYDAARAEYWMANRMHGAEPDESIEVVLAKLRELVEVGEEALADALPGMRRSAVRHALVRLVQSGRVQVRTVQAARVDGRRTGQLYRARELPAPAPRSVFARQRKVRAHLNALRALAPEYQGRRV